MKEKYTNAFGSVDTSEAKKAISDFVDKLWTAQNSKTEGFPLETQALYDNTFNTGHKEIKFTDIQSMLDLCDKCKVTILDRIDTYKSYYDDTYTPSYTTYTEKYSAWSNLGEKDAGKESAKAALDTATETLNDCEEYLAGLENKIQNAFSE